LKLQQRLDLLKYLKDYLSIPNNTLKAAIDKAYNQNTWFVHEFIYRAVNNIATHLLEHEKLEQWTETYRIPETNPNPQTVGITMAGNIPLVGFHDWLCGFISGNRLLIKPSSKDTVLISHLVETLSSKFTAFAPTVQFAERLNGCDAYIATGSNNTSRYFEYYFGKYPNIIRKNRTSAAVLTGYETTTQLEGLADDMLSYFGLGCRNVTRLFVPQGYDFGALLAALGQYGWMRDHDKFKNNYDYNLSLLLLNNRYYMTDGTILLVEDEALFSPIAQVNYSFYQPGTTPAQLADAHLQSLQCLCGSGLLPLGQAQQPGLSDYADGVDTLAFMLGLGNKA
jgi:hypothetical protein